MLKIGATMTDFNSGAFTARIDPAKTIEIGHHRTQVGSKSLPIASRSAIFLRSSQAVCRNAIGKKSGQDSLGSC